MTARPRIAVCIPHRAGQCHIALVRTLTGLDFAGAGALVLDHSHTLVSANRNRLVQIAIEHPARPTHLLFLDTDLGLPSHAVAAMLGTSRPIMNGLYVDKRHNRLVARRRSGPFTYESLHDEWCLPPDGPGAPHWLLRPELAGRVMDCDATGAGCLLVQREVFEKVPYPWFFEQYDPGATATSPDAMISEDYSFFGKAAEHGFPCAVHTGVLCYHWSEMTRHPPFWSLAEGTQ